MNDYENISTLESNSYKNLGQLNENSVIATSELSNAISTICYNLSNMLDKRDENSIISGNVEISGSLSANGSFAHVSGTFSINPQDGTKGFYIGSENLCTIIDNAIADVQIPTDLSAFTNSPGYLISNDVRISYSNQTIWLSSKAYVTSVDCIDFIKDGMLSTVELCGTMLVMTFNTDVSSAPISVELSNFVDDYDEKINELSSKKIGYADQLQTWYPGDPDTWPAGSKFIYENVIYESLPGYNGSDLPSESEQCVSCYLATVSYVDASIPKNVSQLSNDAGYLTQHQSLSNYLDKRDERSVVSGGIEIMQHDLSVISGNYIQTSTPLSTNNYSAANGFMQAESIKYGDPAIGSRAYCILSVVVPEKAIIISGDLGYSDIASKQYPTQDSSKTFRDGLGNLSVSLTLKYSLINISNTDPCLSDLMWSLALFNIGDTNFGHLTAIEQTTIGGIQCTKMCFDKLPADIAPAIAGKTLTSYIDEFIDINKDNALYVRGFVELGNQIPPQFTSQYAAGGAVRAIGKYTHAEGRDTIADGRYAHAEGTATIAGGVASHAEGQSTHATGRSSHSEGEGTRAQAAMSHAEGYQAIATGAGAHAEGGYWLSSGYSKNYSGGTASGKASHAEGAQTSAIGEASHAEGYKSNASNTYSHAEGYMSNASGVYSHSEGRITYATSTASHAEGFQTSAIAGHSHAEGYKSIAEGTGSHAEGGYWWGDLSSQHFVGGYARGRGSHAEGFETSAMGDASHAAGIKSKALSSYQWVWNGDSSKIYTAISGEGTFCVNPKGGLSSFYIGSNSLCSLIQNATSGGNKVQSTIIDALRGVGLSANTLSSDIDAGQVLQFMSKLTHLLA